MNENAALLAGADLSVWNESDKAILAALFSVKIVSAEEIGAIKPGDYVTRGEAAQAIYRMTKAGEAEPDVPGDDEKPSGESGGKRCGRRVRRSGVGEAF